LTLGKNTRIVDTNKNLKKSNMAGEKEFKKEKIFVLDTSAILYDFNIINSFRKHRIAIPITVLEELDDFKKGEDTKNFTAREFTRLVDELSEKSKTLAEWIPLGEDHGGEFKVAMNGHGKIDTEKIFGEEKNDHKILNIALSLKEENPEYEVILISKDINLRLKAKSFDLNAEDYETGKIKNIDELYTGKTKLENLSGESINKLFSDETGVPFSEFITKRPLSNHYFFLNNGKSSGLGYFNPESSKIERVEKFNAFGVKPLNAEQAFALHAIMNPRISLATIQGVAGTGKTLLALAGALEQKGNFRQIFLARPIVPLSNKDIGFLPGDIKSKLDPYMQPLWDNLNFIRDLHRVSEDTLENRPKKKKLSKDYSKSKPKDQVIKDLLDNEKLIVTPLAYIRGRSLSNIFFIVDEAQNLTPHEVKTIITRAGDNTKLIFTGDIHQIDTPYLDARSNGLSYLIDKLKGSSICAHVTLEKGERSELANLANELL